MRVLFITNYLGVGGVERKVALLAAGLIERGHQVDVSTFYPCGAFEDAVHATGARVISVVDDRSVPRVRGWIRVRRWLHLRRVIRENRYDAVYSVGAHVNPIATLSVMGSGSALVWGIEVTDWARGRIAKLFELLLSRFPDLVIPVSGETRDAHVQRGFPASRMVVIDNGADMERFCVDPVTRETTRSALGVAPHHALVGMVGRIALEKNVEGFLDAAMLLASNRDDLRFAIVGPGADAAHGKVMRQRAERLGLGDVVIWTGSQLDVERFFNAFDVYVSTSHVEGFQITRIEAMACGTPCVLTDVSDAHRIVGPMGRVVPVDDPAATAAAIEEVLDAPELRDRERIRQWVVERFSAERQVERTEAALLAAVANGMRGSV